MTRSNSEHAITINVTPAGVPGIVFHLNNSEAALEHIITSSGRASRPSPLFLYGAGTEPSTMTFKPGFFVSLQAVFKPHALGTIFGLNASALTNGWATPDEFWAEDLTSQLIGARNEHERVRLLMAALVAKLKQEKPRDLLVEESLQMIDANIGGLKVRDLLTSLNISERQFERRFLGTVGLSPHVYLRVKRFNEAIRLMQARRFSRLTDVASALNFSDQSHFTRDIKIFSGMTPKRLAQVADETQHGTAGFSYRET
jgi:AraC-like DNA-binding protein